MDSLSQAVLGSTVSLIATRGKHPKRAIIYGALLGTLPDLDVIFPSENDLQATISHRTWSHSWFAMTLAAPVIATIIHRFDKHFSWLNWLLLVWLTFITHSALDAFTIYGTGVFWPFTEKTVIGGSIFIIDPLFTLPMVVCAILGLREKYAKSMLRNSIIAVILSASYLGWGLYSQNHIQQIAETSLQQQQRTYKQLVATPTPFNSLLWRVLAVSENQYHEGFYSWFDSEPVIEFHSFDRHVDLMEDMDDQTDWEKFVRFSHDYVSASIYNENVIGNDLRMGIEPFYFFRFKFGQDQNGSYQAITPKYAELPFEGGSFFRWLWRRMWNQDITAFSQH